LAPFDRQRRRKIATAGRLSAALFAVLVSLTASSGIRGVRGEEPGAALREALRSRPRVRVVVALREPRTPVARLSGRIAEIQSTQAGVLAGLEPDDFRLTHRWASISALAGEVTATGLAKLLGDPDVEQVDLDVSGTAGLAESVPMTRADDVHDLGFTGKGVVVAVLDSGIDTDHPDLKNNLADQQCFCAAASGAGCCPNGATQQSGPGAAEDDHGHGTNVSGIIAGQGRVAARGMAPDAKIVAIKVLDAAGSFSSTTQVISGFDYVITRRPDVKVVNMSLGTANLFSGSCDGAASFTTAFAQAINSLRARGAAVFASSLNNGSSSQIGLPACITNAIAVGAVYDGNVGTISFGCVDATTKADQVCCFSNSSPAVDLLAPGGAISSSGRGGGVSTFLGTSQAAPHAAGAAALLLEAKPGLTADQVEAALKNTGVPVTDPKSGLRITRIDVRAALDSVR
jgi:subtilisin family serine protease